MSDFNRILQLLKENDTFEPELKKIFDSGKILVSKDGKNIGYKTNTEMSLKNAKFEKLVKEDGQWVSNKGIKRVYIVMDPNEYKTKFLNNSEKDVPENSIRGGKKDSGLGT